MLLSTPPKLETIVSLKSARNLNHKSNCDRNHKHNHNSNRVALAVFKNKKVILKLTLLSLLLWH
jgi:hypothetical protein